MSMLPNERKYEFDAHQDARFSRLASAMTFVAIAMLIPCVIAAATAVLLARSTMIGSLLIAPLAIIIAVMAAQLYVAARRFHRVVSTRDNDIDNLMVAIDHMATAYRVQRWLWIVISIVVLVALATTVVGR